MRMDRSRSVKGRRTDHRDDDFVPGSMAARISLVWTLTREVAALNRRYDVERRLQRDVVVLIRNKRASGRTKDLADVEALQRLGHDEL